MLGNGLTFLVNVVVRWLMAWMDRRALEDRARQSGKAEARAEDQVIAERQEHDAREAAAKVSRTPSDQIFTDDGFRRD
jgi:hypothetical protein